MHIGTSRADRLGFIVFAVLTALVAVLLITSLNNDESESAQAVSTFAAPPESTPVPTTAPLAIPEPTETPTPFPTAVPTVAPTPEPDPEPELEKTSSADGSNDDSGQSDTPSSGDGSTSAAPAPGAGGDSANAQPQGTAVPNPQPQTTAVPNPQPQTTAVPNPQPQTTSVPNPQAPAPTNLPAPVAQGGTFTHTLTATVSQPTLYTSAGGSAFIPTFNGTALPPVNPTVFGNPLVYRVIAGSPDDTSGWAQVYVPARPNGTTAWVQTSQFRWGSSNRLIQINVGNNTVTVFDGANVLLTTGAVTGKGSSRTPIANGWVEEVIDGGRLGAAYGPVALSLGLFSNDLNSFGGSVPKIALHGTSNPSLIGQYASNGCIRVRNDIITQIRGLVPIGSRVEIISA